MNLPRLALCALFVLVAGLVSATAGTIVHASEEAHPASHFDSSSCPDPCDDGVPCGPSCPCACCPGHATVVVFAAVRPVIPAPPIDELESPSHDILEPQDVHFRIFRPPRA